MILLSQYYQQRLVFFFADIVIKWPGRPDAQQVIYRKGRRMFPVKRGPIFNHWFFCRVNMGFTAGFQYR